MINILLVRDRGMFIKLKVYGHSGYDNIGRDIVCASISTLSQSVIVGLERVISGEFFYCIDDNDAILSIDISNYNQENLKLAQILMKTFKYTVDSLLLDYKNYISMRVEEQ